MKKTLIWLVVIAVAVVLIVIWAGRTQAPEAPESVGVQQTPQAELTPGDTIPEIEQDLQGLELEDLEQELQGLEGDLQQL